MEQVHYKAGALQSRCTVKQALKQAALHCACSTVHCGINIGAASIVKSGAETTASVQHNSLSHNVMGMRLAVKLNLDDGAQGVVFYFFTFAAVLK